ncbi:hypothetical protein ENBRE01_3236 [Enteropsectra breve]|nr:hypothetical protein ENBRE01_3236 [Enteropsectra breve]
MGNNASQIQNSFYLVRNTNPNLDLLPFIETIVAYNGIPLTLTDPRVLKDVLAIKDLDLTVMNIYDRSTRIVNIAKTTEPLGINIIKVVGPIAPLKIRIIQLSNAQKTNHSRGIEINDNILGIENILIRHEEEFIEHIKSHIGEKIICIVKRDMEILRIEMLCKENMGFELGMGLNYGPVLNSNERCKMNLAVIQTEEGELQEQPNTDGIVIKEPSMAHQEGIPLIEEKPSIKQEFNLNSSINDISLNENNIGNNETNIATNENNIATNENNFSLNENNDTNVEANGNSNAISDNVASNEQYRSDLEKDISFHSNLNTNSASDKISMQSGAGTVSEYLKGEKTAGNEGIYIENGEFTKEKTSDSSPENKDEKMIYLDDNLNISNSSVNKSIKEDMLFGTAKEIMDDSNLYDANINELKDDTNTNELRDHSLDNTNNESLQERRIDENIAALNDGKINNPEPSADLSKKDSTDDQNKSEKNEKDHLINALLKDSDENDDFLPFDKK